jgi:large subunit ribosomal protein L7/L12
LLGQTRLWLDKHSPGREESTQVTRRREIDPAAWTQSDSDAGDPGVEEITGHAEEDAAEPRPRSGLFRRRGEQKGSSPVDPSKGLEAALGEATKALADAVDQFKSRVKARERERNTVSKAGAKRVKGAAKDLDRARTVPRIARAGQISVYEDRVQTPQGTFQLDEQASFAVDTAGNMSVTRRLTLTRAAVVGPLALFAPKKTKHDDRELYFIAEHPNWSAIAKLNPDAGMGARQAAQAANMAARQASASRARRQQLIATAAASAQAAERQASEELATAEQELRVVFADTDAISSARSALDRQLKQRDEWPKRLARGVEKAMRKADDAIQRQIDDGASPAVEQVEAGLTQPALEAPKATGGAPEAADRAGAIPPAGEVTAQVTADSADGDRVDLHLADSGRKKIQVIKIVKATRGLGLKEAKTLVDNAPQLILSQASRAEAEVLKAQLEAVGAVAEIVGADTGAAEQIATEATSTEDAEDVFGHLKKLGELRELDVLTEEEFEAKKKDLLDRL